MSATRVLFSDGSSIDHAARIGGYTRNASGATLFLGTDVPLFAAQAGSGTCTTNGTTTVGANSGTFNSSMVGKTITIQGAHYVITAYTNSTHVTVNSAVPTASGVMWAVYTPDGISVPASGPDDVYNIQATLSVNTSSAVNITVAVSVDGAANTNAVTMTVGSSTTGNYPLPYTTLLSGLSAGTHSLSLQITASANGATVSGTVLVMRYY